MEGREQRRAGLEPGRKHAAPFGLGVPSCIHVFGGRPWREWLLSWEGVQAPMKTASVPGTSLAFPAVAVGGSEPAPALPALGCESRTGFVQSAQSDTDWRNAD